jgi:hypothetical protein
MHALTSTAAPVSIRTTLTARTGGRPIAGWEWAHSDGSVRPDDPTNIFPEVCWPVVAKENTVVEAITRVADAIKNERSTTSVCLLPMPVVLSWQDFHHHLPGGGDSEG